MGDLLDQFIIEVKKLGKFLEIEEVKEEPHHSKPYNRPVKRIRRPSMTWEEKVERRSQKIEGHGLGYVERCDSPKEAIMRKREILRR